VSETSYFDILNPPVDIELGPRDKPIKLKARKVGVGKVIAAASALIVSRRIAQAREAASGMSFAERAEFLIKALDAIPNGAELQKQSLGVLATAEGTAHALLCCLTDENKPAPTIDDILRLVWLTDPADIRALVHLLCEL